MRKFCLRVLCLSLSLMMVKSDGAAQHARVGRTINELMKKYDAVGLSVAVVKNNGIAYSHAFGYKNAETKKKLRPKDIFRIASISKSFSATAMMRLIEAGKISLDDDFSDLIGFPIRNPKYPDKKITLRMILSHTSSINDSEGYFNLDVINPATNPDYCKCYSDYAPGEGYRYCNLNFNMAGTVIERLSGERFDQYISHHILKPLDLYGGYCIDSLNANLFAAIYEYDSASKTFIESVDAYNPRREEIRNYRMGYSTPVFSPTGGMKISAKDLARYMQMHMNKGELSGVRIIGKNSAEEMQTPVAVKEGYGLALLSTDKFIDGKRLIGHTGSAYGLSSAMFFDPEKKYGMVLITNGCNAPYINGWNPFLKEVADVLYRAYLTEQ